MERRGWMRGQQRAAGQGSMQGWGDRQTLKGESEVQDRDEATSVASWLERLEKMRQIFMLFSIIHIFYFKDRFSSFLFWKNFKPISCKYNERKVLQCTPSYSLSIFANCWILSHWFHFSLFTHVSVHTHILFSFKHQGTSEHPSDKRVGLLRNLLVAKHFRPQS